VNNSKVLTDFRDFYMIGVLWGVGCGFEHAKDTKIPTPFRQTIPFYISILRQLDTLWQLEIAKLVKDDVMAKYGMPLREYYAGLLRDLKLEDGTLDENDLSKKYLEVQEFMAEAVHKNWELMSKEADNLKNSFCENAYNSLNTLLDALMHENEELVKQYRFNKKKIDEATDQNTRSMVFGYLEARSGFAMLMANAHQEVGDINGTREEIETVQSE